MLARGSSDTESVSTDIATVCRTDVEDDGISFDLSNLSVEPIRAQDEYAGVRVLFDARLGTIRERLQVDIGFGDVVWPQAEEMEYPVALGDPAPLIRAYRPETVIAEKLEAIVSLGIRNSRIKDFLDINYLARTERFERTALVEAVRHTFQQRGTPIPAEPPIGLSAEFWSQPGRDAQARAFARRSRLVTTSDSARELGKRVAEFALPILQAASEVPSNSDLTAPDASANKGE